MSEGNYIRGAGVVKVDPRRVGWVLAVAAVTVLAVSTVLVLVATTAGNSKASKLLRNGVPVQATVTRCTGITSGIGMGVEYYECRGTYTLDGATFDEVIHGSRDRMPAGQVVSALAIPGDPSSLGLPGAARSSSVGSYTVPIVLGAVTLAGAAGLVVWRRRAGAATGAGAPAGSALSAGPAGP